VKKSVGDRIRRIRQSQNIKRDDVADELDISNSAYSKIERGETDVQVTRLESIAKILKVNVVDFFQDKRESLHAGDPGKQYGFATKGDIEELTHMMKDLKLEFEKLKIKMSDPKKQTVKKRK
jgi:transcriptional regulator with XRE-family HTH domain